MNRLFICTISLVWFGFFAAAHAQSELVEIQKSEAWSIYKSVRGAPECGVVSRPRKTVNKREGRIVEVVRGEISLYIVIIPDDSNKQMVSFQAGYPLKSDTVVQLEIGSRSFNMFPGNDSRTNEWAWPEEGTDDAVIDALKRGRDAVITGVSHRDTVTEDTFSLIGITSAIRVAEDCAADL